MAAWLIPLLLWGATHAAAAQERASDARATLLVLRTEVGREAAAVATEVDRALSQALHDAPGFSGTYFSPTPFEDIELAAGCEGTTAECLRRVSATLEADWVLVRELRRDARGGWEVTLVAQDAAGELGVRRALGRVARTGDARPEYVMPQLVERLYPEPTDLEREDAPVDAPAPAQSPEQGPRVLPVFGWSTIAAASALLSTGVAVGVAASSDRDEYARLDVQSASDADRALSLRDRADRRSNVANGLLIGGAAAGAAGAAMLLWDALSARPSEHPERVRVSASANRHGGSLSLSGPIGSGGRR